MPIVASACTLVEILPSEYSECPFTELSSCAPEIRCLFAASLSSSALAAAFGPSGVGESGTGIFNVGYSADNGSPDVARVHISHPYTIYDPLVAWEMDVSDRPASWVPGLATEWKVDDRDKRSGLHAATVRI